MKKFCYRLAMGVLFLVLFSPVVLAMSSTNYEIDWDSMNIGGEDTSSSTNYQIRDTLGEIGTGVSSSASYEVRAGYRQGITEIPLLNFSLSTQDNASQVTYSAFNNAGEQVTVSSTAGYLVNDYIAVVENKGGGQLVAIGKITNIAALVITVDKWSGDNGSINAVPAGSDDYVYELNGSAAQLGTLSTSTIETAVTRIEVTTNTSSGYTSTITEDGNLRTGAGADIDDVVDGTVTADNDEYGISTTGDDAAGVSDFAITGGTTNVATKATYGNERRTAIIYQAAVSFATSAVATSYSHIVTYITTANF